MKKPAAFITGVTGFAGSHLAEELLAGGYDVVGTLLPGESTGHLAGIINNLRLVELDIQDQKRTAKTVARFAPDYLFHLAAFASVGRSFQHERQVYSINFHGTLNVLDAATSMKKLKKLVFVSSSDCYGRFSPKTKTLTESQPLNPISPYGISKAAAEFACQLYFNRRELPVTIARSFNHSGPRQSEHFVIPSFAKQIAAIEKGKAKPIMFVGDLSVKRDISDVRDIVRGYRLLAEKGQPGRAYHLCSGRAVTIKTILNELLRLSCCRIEVKTDRTRLRREDIPCLRGDNSLATRKLGYRIRYRLGQTVGDTLDYWRNNTRG